MSRDRLVLVTQNQHKLKELTPLFKKYDVEFDTTSLEKHEIRSESIEEIAREAVKVAFETLQKPVVVDDTGFFVDSLNGFPGSYASIVLNFIGFEGILRLMSHNENRASEFMTAVGYYDGQHLESFVGTMSGVVAHEPAGEDGFGYDPIFVPEGYTKTYAELTLDEKVGISHRTRAFETFLIWYSSTLDKP
ncbi:MAG: XTP/dITP diphosphatase [Candidatus Thorarchaeota archaeon]|nr:XTP/dITP diphosphatase [Candidatus Thorarchaeota archaeon]